MITDVQKQQLEVLDQARIMCEAAGLVAKVAGHGVLLLVLPVYGDPATEQMLLDAAAPAGA